AKDTSVTDLPTDLLANKAFIVRTELSLDHEILLMLPGLQGTVINPVTLEKTSYFRQRVGSEITCSDCT
ncbi:pilus assembly protein, partial [Rhizobium sp. TRM95111]|nr:pilus assembly protein [Rhizobium alarense]